MQVHNDTPSTIRVIVKLLYVHVLYKCFSFLFWEGISPRVHAGKGLSYVYCLMPFTIFTFVTCMNYATLRLHLVYIYKYPHSTCLIIGTHTSCLCKSYFRCLLYNLSMNTLSVTVTQKQYHQENFKCINYMINLM